MAATDQAGDALMRRRLTGLMLLRTAVVTVLLGVLLALQLGGTGKSNAPFLTSFIAITYLLTIGYGIALRFLPRPPMRLMATLQLSGDVITTSVLSFFTGGAESPFAFLYSLSVIGAAVVLSRRAAMVAAAVSAASLSLGTLLLRAGVLTASFTLAGRAPAATVEVAFALLVNVAAFFLVGLLGGSLAHELAQAGANLAASQLRFRDLAALLEHTIEGLTSGLITTDLDKRVIIANGAACDLLLKRSGTRARGTGPTPLSGLPLGEIMPVLAEMIDEASNRPDARLVRIEATDHRAGAEPENLVLGASVSPLWDHERRQVGWILSFQDVTRLKQLEGQVRRAERLASIGRLAAAIAHEIRNPLGAISGSVELIKLSPGMGPEEHRLVDIAVSETERLDRLIRGLLDYARPSKPDLTQTSLTQLAHEALEAFGQDPANRGLELKFDGGPEGSEGRELWVQGDPGQLRQVLWNLLRNAAEAQVGREGALTISVHPDGDDPAGSARLEVRDQGSGIPEAELEHIFEPFYSTKQAGTGLGLATVHRIVEEHHGRVEVRSDATGTTVTMILPLASEEPRTRSKGFGRIEIADRGSPTAK